MAACILRFYRATAADNGFEAASGSGRDSTFLATADTVVGTDAQRREAAVMAGAQVVELEGAGHWWMTQDVVTTAASALIALTGANLGGGGGGGGGEKKGVLRVHSTCRNVRASPPQIEWLFRSP